MFDSVLYCKLVNSKIVLTFSWGWHLGLGLEVEGKKIFFFLKITHIHKNVACDKIKKVEHEVWGLVGLFSIE